MSWDITLNNPVTNETINFDTPHQMHGGTYIVGGTTEAWLNITYNYSRWYYRTEVFGKRNGIKVINNMSAADSISIIEKAISGLKSTTEDFTDKERKEMEDNGVVGYWLPTKENAIKPLYQLLAMAKMRPDGIWKVL